MLSLTFVSNEIDRSRCSSTVKIETKANDEHGRPRLPRPPDTTLLSCQVLELRPKVDWNKGSAVNWILDALDLGERDDVFPIYLGDDITDEDAFVAMETRCAGSWIFKTRVLFPLHRIGRLSVSCLTFDVRLQNLDG